MTLKIKNLSFKPKSKAFHGCVKNIYMDCFDMANERLLPKYVKSIIDPAKELLSEVVRLDTEGKNSEVKR